MSDPNLRRLLRLNKSIFPTSHYAFLTKPDDKDKKIQIFHSLFIKDLNQFGMKTVNFEKQKSGKDPYSKLPKLINILRKCLTDEEYIWK